MISIKKNHLILFFLFSFITHITKSNANTLLLYKSPLLIVTKTKDSIVIKPTLYNKVVINLSKPEGIVVNAIINHPSFIRLKEIAQYGASEKLECARKLLYHLYENEGKKYPGFYNRYEHSLCVYAILRHHVKNINERIAGLIHDIAHPPLSHMADLFLEDLKGQDHDQRIGEFLKHTNLSGVLEQEGIKIKDVIFDKDQENLIAVKRPKPHLSADRIEYTITGGYLCNRLKAQDVKHILSSLNFNENAKWFFNNKEAAQLFGAASIYMTKYYTGVDWNTVLGRILLEILKEASLFFSNDEMHQLLYEWGDKMLWQKLKKLRSESLKIHTLLNIINHMNNTQKHPTLFCLKHEPSPLTKTPHYIHHSPAPSRICDPCIKINGECVKLSKIDTAFEEEKSGFEFLLKMRHIGFTNPYLALLFKNSPIKGY